MWELSLFFIFSLMVGSFFNVVIHRLPKQLMQDWKQECCELLDLPPKKEDKRLSLLWGRSYCPHCKKPIRAWHNIPLLGFLWLKGKCKDCHKPIAKRYFIVELATGLLSLFTIIHFGFGAIGYFALALVWGLILLTAIDFETQLLPDPITLPLLWLGLIANLSFTFGDIHSAVWGAVAGYMSLWIIAKGFKLVTGRDGMGHGDFKLFAVAGAWFGWQQLLPVILIASLVGAVAGVFILWWQRKHKLTPIAFGPYLALSMLINLYWGHSLVSGYLHWIGAQ